MQKLTHTQWLDEAQKQSHALDELRKWRNNLFLLMILALIGGGWGLFGTGVRLAAGVVCAITAVLLLLLCGVVVYGLHRGQRNVSRIREAMAEPPLSAENRLDTGRFRGNCK